MTNTMQRWEIDAIGERLAMRTVQYQFRRPVKYWSRCALSR